LLDVDVSVYKNEIYQPKFVEYFALRYKTITSILRVLQKGEEEFNKVDPRVGKFLSNPSRQER
jgi:hypothetical protein